MRRPGAWSFATATGPVAVAPDEIRTRGRLRAAVVRAGRSPSQGRVAPVVDAVGWSGIGAAFTVLGALPRLLSLHGGSGPSG